MKYIEVSIKITPFNETITDILSSHLGNIGYDSFVTTSSGLEAYVPQPNFIEEDLKEVLAVLAENFSDLLKGVEISYDFKTLKDENWNEEWEKNYFAPLVINNRCLVKSSFHQVNKRYEYEITIDPKMAFGTGHHQTTHLILQEILDFDLNACSILDIGCGTAVLAILASMRGAKNVVAIDFDKWAYENAKENVLLNKISNIDVRLGEVSLVANEKFDFIFANINRNVLLQDIKQYAKVMNKNAKLIMSGFYLEDRDVLKAECEKQGLFYEKIEQMDKWCAITCSKS